MACTQLALRCPPMEGKAPGILKLVLVPALLTLVVTVLRLYGELNAWDPFWVGTKAGGGGGGLIAITWLVLVFGFWFGIRLQRSGKGVAKPGRALLLGVVAFAVFAGLMAGFHAADLVTFPNEEHPVEARGALYVLIACAAGSLVSFVAWGRAALTLLVYAIFARIPVLVVTWLAIDKQWDTHYAKVAPGFLPPPADQTFNFLMTPQISFWPAFTIMAGTILACLGALLFGRRKPA